MTPTHKPKTHKAKDTQESFVALLPMDRKAMSSNIGGNFATMGSGLLQLGPHSCFQPPQRFALTQEMRGQGMANPATPDQTQNNTTGAQGNDRVMIPPLLRLDRRPMGGNGQRPPTGGAAPMLPDSFSEPTSASVLFPRSGRESPLLLEEPNLPYLPMQLSSGSPLGPPRIAPTGKLRPLALGIDTGSSVRC